MRSIQSPARLLLLVILLAGCSTTSISGATPTNTTPPIATAPPIPTIAPAILAACFGADATRPQQAIQVGDLLITQVELGGLSYPAVMLPDNAAPTKPFLLHRSDGDAYQTDFPHSPITNPSMEEHGGGFQFSICNISTTSPHVLKSVSAKISALTTYTGQVNQWQACEGTLSSHHQLAGGGCGGGLAGCICFRAKFPDTATAGTDVPMSQTDTTLNDPGDGLGKLPLSLGPGEAVTLLVGMEKPKAPATYTFTFGLTFDSAAAVFTPASPAVLLAPIAHSWTGENCQKPALLAQITATNPETYYICA